MDANTRASRISRGIPTGKEWIPRGGNFILHLEKQVIASINETIGGNVVAVSQPNDTCSLRCKASGGGVAILGLIIEPHLQIWPVCFFQIIEAMEGREQQLSAIKGSVVDHRP